MTTYRFIGDVHGKFRQYSTILDNSPHKTIQIGDMGIGFRKFPHGEPSSNPHYDKMVAGGHRFIRGNHDNPGVCKSHTQYIPDGHVEIDEARIMFIGGALSIDKAYRIEDYSYWADEELSIMELLNLHGKYSMLYPDIMITHECPESIAEIMVNLTASGTKGFSPVKLDPRFASRTRQAFQAMFEWYQPKLWIAGHWHVPFDEVIHGTRFIVLPELRCRDVNTDTFEVSEML